jgi:hypothetical protein
MRFQPSENLLPLTVDPLPSYLPMTVDLRPSTSGLRPPTWRLVLARHQHSTRRGPGRWLFWGASAPDLFNDAGPM